MELHRPRPHFPLPWSVVRYFLKLNAHLAKVGECAITLWLIDYGRWNRTAVSLQYWSYHRIHHWQSWYIRSSQHYRSLNIYNGTTMLGFYASSVETPFTRQLTVNRHNFPPVKKVSSFIQQEQTVNSFHIKNSQIFLQIEQAAKPISSKYKKC